MINVTTCFVEKNPQRAFLQREIKPSVPCRKFTACKKESRHFRQNSRQLLTHSSTFRCLGSLASFQTLGTPGGGSWNYLITGPPIWGFDVPLAMVLCKNTFLLRILNDIWAGQNPQGLQCQLKKKKKSLHWNIISCNINPGFPQIAPGINVGAKGLNFSTAQSSYSLLIPANT